MALKFQVLGKAGRDNALYLTIDTGQKVSRLLFDCGEGCLSNLAVSEIMAIDHLFFSHFHMDHIAGFDNFFRMNFDRRKENHIWGPPLSYEIMQHRFQGFMWNLFWQMEAEWLVHDIHIHTIENHLFRANEAFSQAYPLETSSRAAVILDTSEYHVEAYLMNHETVSVAYIVREKPSFNIDIAKLKDMGLTGGSWLQAVKNSQLDNDTLLEIKGTSYRLGNLREVLLVETRGQSLAYLTDFLMDEAAQAVLVDALKGCTSMICESQYLSEDWELAEKNYHMTSSKVAETAKLAGVHELILFHVSDRYEKAEWDKLLQEAQAIFPNTRFPDSW